MPAYFDIDWGAPEDEADGCWSRSSATTTAGSSRRARSRSTATAGHSSSATRARPAGVAADPRRRPGRGRQAGRRRRAGRHRRPARSLPDAARRDPEASARRHRDKEVLGRRWPSCAPANQRSGRPSMPNWPSSTRTSTGSTGCWLRQNYRLAHWRTASEELDYRRFFNIDRPRSGLRMEDAAVFDDTHELVLGSRRRRHRRRPAGRPRRRAPRPRRLPRPAAASAHRAVGVVVEKILELGEALPPSGRWPARRVTTSSTGSTACSSTAATKQPFTRRVAAVHRRHRPRTPMSPTRPSSRSCRTSWPSRWTACPAAATRCANDIAAIATTPVASSGRACRELLAVVPRVPHLCRCRARRSAPPTEAVVAEAVRSAIERDRSDRSRAALVRSASCSCSSTTARPSTSSPCGSSR